MTSNSLRRVALVALAVSAAGSVGSMLVVGHRAPIFLMVLFFGWVLAPFAALAWACRTSARWAEQARARVDWVTIVVALGSLALYADVVLRPPAASPASIFLLVPVGSWLLMAIAFISARRATDSGKRIPQGSA